MTAAPQKKTNRTAIQPTREENYPEWYQQVVRAADLAETSPVRGAMVIKPWGFAMWENVKEVLDKQFRKRGVRNYYFPLLIPVEFLAREAEHIEGFAKECAVVTHHRLEADGKGGLKPAGELTEPYIIRPTSETIIGDMCSNWVQSYRDLPLMINQWCNVMRWEMRTRLFLRTSEFLWQEGHTVHATAEEADALAREMSDVYASFMREYLAVAVLEGSKVPAERFPGAEDSYTCEAMMQDGKALQMGTSHYLGQNFSKAMNISFLDKDGEQKLGYTTSWGVSTRMIGGLIMQHSDDDGLVVPPKIAPAHVAIIPILHKEEEAAAVLAYCEQLTEKLEDQTFDGKPIRVEFDRRDIKSSEKTWDWVKKGIPIRLEIGPRDLEKNAVAMGRRDLGPKDKEFLGQDDFIAKVPAILQEMQDTLLQRAEQMLADNIKEITSKADLYDYFDKNKPKVGFAKVYMNPAAEVWEPLKSDLSITPRCIAFADEGKTGACIITGEEGAPLVTVARSY